MSFCRKGAKWLDGLRIFFMTSGWRKVVQIKEMNFWGVEKSKGTWCEIEYEGQEEEEEVFWGAKEEKRKRPSTEHRRGKMGSKATSKLGGGAILRSRKGNGFLREPEGQGYKQARGGGGEMKDREKEAEGSSSDLIYKGRWWLEDKNRAQRFLHSNKKGRIF